MSTAPTARAHTMLRPFATHRARIRKLPVRVLSVFSSRTCTSKHTRKEAPFSETACKYLHNTALGLRLCFHSTQPDPNGRGSRSDSVILAQSWFHAGLSIIIGQRRTRLHVLSKAAAPENIGANPQSALPGESRQYSDEGEGGDTQTSLSTHVTRPRCHAPADGASGCS